MNKAIILSAGFGRRMERDTPKQYLILEEKPLIYYTIKAFQNSNIDEIVLVTGKKDIEYCKKDIVERYGFNKVTVVTEGGKERYNSVYNGIMAARACNNILIHDGARAFITETIINRMLDGAMKYKACVAAVKVKDTIKYGNDNNEVVSTPDRNYLWQIQTPQAFDYSMIKEAYKKVIVDSPEKITDDAMVWERVYDIPVKLIESEYTNIKITTPEDMIIGEAFLKDKKD